MIIVEAYEKDKWITVNGTHVQIDKDNNIKNKKVSNNIKVSDFIKDLNKSLGIKSVNTDKVLELERETDDIALRYKESDKDKIRGGMQKVRKSLSMKVNPIEKEEKDLKEIMDKAGCTEEIAEKSYALADSIFNNSYEMEKIITKDILSIVDMLGGNMFGLDHRLKQTNSLARKIAKDANEEYKGSLEDASKDIKDSIRYTAVFNKDSFTNSYNSVKTTLERKGYKELRCKNFYTKYKNHKTNQKAVQCVYQDSKGNRFELQFHTIESQGAKMVNHPLYEEYRKVGVSPKDRKVLNKRMINISSNIPDPKGVFDIKEHG